MGDKLRVEESSWTLNLLVLFNVEKPPFDDVRVRKALLMAIDRWGGSQGLSRISTLRSVGGVVRPGSPLATPEAELVKLPGFSKDIKKSREEARKLLKEAGVGRHDYFFALNFLFSPSIRSRVMLWTVSL
jgi:peptide/nickel transport system substrate-binding protein